MPVSCRDHLNGIFSARAEAAFLIRAEDGLTLTYGQTLAKAAGLAAFLRAEGLTGASPLAFSVDNCLELAYWYLGAMLLGVPVLPVNPALAAGDALKILTALEVRHLVTTPSVLAGRQEAWGGLKQLKIYCFQPEARKTREAFKGLVNLDIGALPAEAPPFEENFTASDDATLLFVPTSGTGCRMWSNSPVPLASS